MNSVCVCVGGGGGGGGSSKARETLNNYWEKKAKQIDYGVLVNILIGQIYDLCTSRWISRSSLLSIQHTNQSH